MSWVTDPCCGPGECHYLSFKKKGRYLRMRRLVVLFFFSEYNWNVCIAGVAEDTPALYSPHCQAQAKRQRCSWRGGGREKPAFKWHSRYPVTFWQVSLTFASPASVTDMCVSCNCHLPAVRGGGARWCEAHGKQQGMLGAEAFFIEIVKWNEFLPLSYSGKDAFTSGLQQTYQVISMTMTHFVVCCTFYSVAAFCGSVVFQLALI